MKTFALIAIVALFAPLARPADTDSMENVVRAVYDVISGPVGPRDWARFHCSIRRRCAPDFDARYSRRDCSECHDAG